ncbi:hypothetical protein Leryth_010945 [Lithospermum erythrorhizon]|nr:hypothetical protein Leryth_010945 [Lithospermum erythrorhizon]
MLSLMKLFTTLSTPLPHHRTTTSLSATSPSPPPHHLTHSIQFDTLKTLEWPSLCNQLSPFTSTSMGLSAAQTAAIPLGQSPAQTQQLLAQTSAALAINGPVDFSGVEDISPIIEIAVNGKLLSIREICIVRRTIVGARFLLQQLEDISFNNQLRDRCSPLLEILQKCNFLKELEQKIDFCIDCNISVILDRASEELEIIRLERKRNMEALESLLKQVSVQIFQAGGIDKPVVTERRSRMCVAIRASHRSIIRNGIVLDSSSSGATYFVEPKEAVELNNMEVRLCSSEKIEEQAILSMLTAEISHSELEIKNILDRVLEVDLAFARAAHARWADAVCPVFDFASSERSDSGGLLLDIEGIQHPLLLESSLRKTSDTVALKSVEPSSTSLDQGNDTTSTSVSPVPIDVKVGNDIKVVVISGPNTGGKTASMKTLGLSSLMLKAGMFVSAKNHPRLPWFDLILADIGDQQSLEQSLSTFSGHISRICNILEVATKDSLILIDEIGCGTDPSEGVALSASILQFLKDRAKLTVVTTHYADLTCLKEKDTRFENAAMEFSLETLKPTYHILWGTTGKSNALSIAKSIGFNAEIIRCAQAWLEKLNPEEMQKRHGLLYQSLMEERNRLEAEAKKASSFHSDVMYRFNEIMKEARDLDEREAVLKEKEKQQRQQEVIAAKCQIEAVLQEFEKDLRDGDSDQYSTLLKKAESAIATIVELHQPGDDLSLRESTKNAFPMQLGDQVYVEGLGKKLATIAEARADDGTVLVRYGKVRIRVDVNKIRPPAVDEKAAVTSKPRSTTQRTRDLKNLRNISQTSTTPVGSYGPVVQTSKNTIDLRGMRLEEASLQLKLAVNLCGSNSVLFIIHGMGTGAVKECVMKLLSNHPRVAKFEQESPTNYGCTVAYIK